MGKAGCNRPSALLLQGPRVVLWVAGHSGGLGRAEPVGGETGAPAKAGGEVPTAGFGETQRSQRHSPCAGDECPSWED